LACSIGGPGDTGPYENRSPEGNLIPYGGCCPFQLPSLPLGPPLVLVFFQSLFFRPQNVRLSVVTQPEDPFPPLTLGRLMCRFQDPPFNLPLSLQGIGLGREAFMPDYAVMTKLVPPPPNLTGFRTPAFPH